MVNWIDFFQQHNERKKKRIPFSAVMSEQKFNTKSKTCEQLLRFKFSPFFAGQKTNTGTGRATNENEQVH